MRIRWTPAAADDLEHIKDYLTEHHSHLARSTVLELYEAIRSLKTFPQRGRPGREPGTHELVFSRLPYIAVYRIKEQSVEVLHIYHSAQDRPQIFGFRCCKCLEQKFEGPQILSNLRATSDIGPVSRILYDVAAVTVIPLGPSSLKGSSDLPGSLAHRADTHSGISA